MARALGDCSKASAIMKNPCVKSTLNQLYEQRYETGDIKFIIESEEIPAHRCVLAALSPKYKAQFYGPMSQKDVIHIEDVSAAAFDEFLQLFYLDEVTLTVENIEDVLDLAKQSLIDKLVVELSKMIIDVAGVSHLIWCYKLALDTHTMPLEELCVRQISTHINHVFLTPGFMSCDHEMLCRILALDTLNCSEMDVFDACIKWARQKCEHEQIDVDNVANLRAALGDAIYKIRFCSMTAKQFAKIDDKYLGLLSEHEPNEIYRTILLKGNASRLTTFDSGNRKSRERMQFLECSFTKGQPIKMRNNVDLDTDGMEFTCDKTINFHGFVICNRIDDDDMEVYVNIFRVPQVFSYTTSTTTDNETKVIFYTPIEVKANQPCEIIFRSQALKRSDAVLHGYNIEKCTEQNDVSFEFDDNSCDRINLITRLLFSNI